MASAANKSYCDDTQRCPGFHLDSSKQVGSRGADLRENGGKQNSSPELGLAYSQLVLCQRYLRFVKNVLHR